MEDIFDIVNEQDQVIGKAPRSVIHQKGHLHRAAHMLIYNQQGQILLQLRSSTKDRHPNKWDSSASGHVDTGEDYLTAAKRETEEELGLSPVPTLIEMAYITVAPETDQEFIKLYIGSSNGPFSPCPNEIQKIEWFSPEQIIHLIENEKESCAPAFAYLWELHHDQIIKHLTH